MLSDPRGAGRAGFTLLELLVALVVMSILAGAVAPAVIQRLTQGQSAALATDFRALNVAIRAYREDTGRFPRRLSLLTAPPAAGLRDSCGGLAPSSTSWRGPYLGQSISTGGLIAGSATIQDSLVRSPADAAGGAFATLSIAAYGVDRDVADQLEKAFDGDADPNGGSIRWSGSGSSGTLLYVLPVRGC